MEKKFKQFVDGLIIERKRKELEERFFKYFDNFLYENYKDMLVDAVEKHEDCVEIIISINDHFLNKVAESIGKNELQKMNITQTSIVEHMMSVYCDIMEFGFVKSNKTKEIFDNTRRCIVIVKLVEGGQE